MRCESESQALERAQASKLLHGEGPGIRHILANQERLQCFAGAERIDVRPAHLRSPACPASHLLHGAQDHAATPVTLADTACLEASRIAHTCMGAPKCPAR